MSNPLLEKYYELHPEKKDKPIPDYYKGEKSYAEELRELQDYADELKKLRDISTISVANPNSLTTNSNYISATNARPKALQTYDVDSCKDAFLQIAEKIKQGAAKVTCVTIDRELVSGYPTKLNTVTFEVQYLDGF